MLKFHQCDKMFESGSTIFPLREFEGVSNRELSDCGKRDRPLNWYSEIYRLILYILGTSTAFCYNWYTVLCTYISTYKLCFSFNLLVNLFEIHTAASIYMYVYEYSRLFYKLFYIHQYTSIVLCSVLNCMYKIHKKVP